VQAYTHYHYAKRKYNRRLVEASNRLSDVIEMKEFVVLEQYVQLVRAQLEHLRAAYEYLYNLDSYVTELQMYIHKVCSRELITLAYSAWSLGAARECSQQQRDGGQNSKGSRRLSRRHKGKNKNGSAPSSLSRTSTDRSSR
jgi:hypothetical protein